jgi:starch synthase
LDGLLRQLGERFSGILNGIDFNEWNPATDPHIAGHYDTGRFEFKTANKLALQEEFGLPLDEKALLFGYVGRLVEQKGVDLILAILPRLLARPRMQIVLQGTGDKTLEGKLMEAQQAYPSRVSVFLGYNEAKAHRIEAGCDSFLMPSRFEPCGLNQLYSLRYGAVPIVHRTGGLADTVVDATPANLEAGTATGFLFDHPDPEGLWYAVRQAIALRERSLEQWQRLALTGMRRDFSWEASARRYEALYRETVSDR